MELLKQICFNVMSKKQFWENVLTMSLLELLDENERELPRHDAFFRIVEKLNALNSDEAPFFEVIQQGTRFGNNCMLVIKNDASVHAAFNASSKRPDVAFAGIRGWMRLKANIVNDGWTNISQDFGPYPCFLNAQGEVLEKPEFLIAVTEESSIGYQGEGENGSRLSVENTELVFLEKFVRQFAADHPVIQDILDVSEDDLAVSKAASSKTVLKLVPEKAEETSGNQPGLGKLAL